MWENDRCMANSETTAFLSQGDVDSVRHNIASDQMSASAKEISPDVTNVLAVGAQRFQDACADGTVSESSGGKSLYMRSRFRLIDVCIERAHAFDHQGTSTRNKQILRQLEWQIDEEQSYYDKGHRRGTSTLRQGTITHYERNIML